MKMTLAENIRRFRKERALTQEQLAEALGVTAGAVYKWEAKLSIPELELILEMADFFDTSVDVLVGYEMKDNRLKETAARLKKYRHDKDPAGLSEAEKALKKYPNSFEIVHESAMLYRAFGLESGKKEHALRALELLNRSLPLLGQNDDPEIGELTICGAMADAYMMSGESRKALELLKRHNVGGYYCDRIGLWLADGSGTDEAVPYLSEALNLHVTALVRTVMGYLNVYMNRGDFSSVEEIMRWVTGVLSGLRRPDTPSYLDKINSLCFVCMAYAQYRTGEQDAARASLQSAKAIAEAFDAAPNYDGNAVRFVEHPEKMSTYDDLGATAMQSVETVIAGFEDETFTALWNEIKEQDIKEAIK